MPDARDGGLTPASDLAAGQTITVTELWVTRDGRTQLAWRVH